MASFDWYVLYRDGVELSTISLTGVDSSQRLLVGITYPVISCSDILPACVNLVPSCH